MAATVTGAQIVADAEFAEKVREAAFGVEVVPRATDREGVAEIQARLRAETAARGVARFRGRAG